MNREQSIFPDAVTTTAPSSALYTRRISVRVDIEFHNEVEVDVRDWEGDKRSNGSNQSEQVRAARIESIAQLLVKNDAVGSHPLRRKQQPKRNQIGGGDMSNLHPPRHAPLDTIVPTSSHGVANSSRYTPPRTAASNVASTSRLAPHQPSSSIVTSLHSSTAQSTLTPTSTAFTSLFPLDGEPTEESEPKRLKLRYLPSLIVHFDLPSNYPETAAPVITLCEDTGWLTRDQIGVLRTKLGEQWSGEECLWIMIDSLRSEELVNLLDLTFPLSIIQAPSSPISPPLSTTLRTFDMTSRRSTFSASSFNCSLCLNSKKGSACVLLASCSHVFCLACLQSYFTLLIQEGLVRNVHCAEVECVRDRVKWNKVVRTKGEVGPGEVDAVELERIVGVALRKRWEKMGEKMRVESDPATSFCPRCQSAVEKPGEEDGKLRTCEKCDYCYCVFCMKNWHGNMNPCSLPQSSAIVSRFLAGTPAEQASLEQRYGAANIKRLVAVLEEERVNREWFEANSTDCPCCLIKVEKSEGCSHMQCPRCGTHFCFRCGDKLSALDPYKHFSTPGLSCYNKLFDFRPGEEPEPAGWREGLLGLEEL